MYSIVAVLLIELNDIIVLNLGDKEIVWFVTSSLLLHFSLQKCLTDIPSSRPQQLIPTDFVDFENAAKIIEFSVEQIENFDNVHRRE